jgi:hypothetical protein
MQSLTTPLKAWVKIELLNVKPTSLCAQVFERLPIVFDLSRLARRYPIFRSDPQGSAGLYAKAGINAAGSNLPARSAGSPCPTDSSAMYQEVSHASEPKDYRTF